MGLTHHNNTPVETTTTNYIYNLLNNYTVQKVKANNGHNKQETTTATQVYN